MEQEKISVIIPVYNVEEYLEKCLESVINQTYKNLEIIIVDDGASDICKQICEKYEQKDKRITVIHTPNQGIASARNTGIKNITGDFIGFVDSDDIVHKTMFEELYNCIKEKQADIAICQYEPFYAEKKIIEKNEENEQIQEYQNEDGIKELLKDNKIASHLWNKLYKKELWKDIYFPEGKTLEDIAVMYKIFAKSNKIECMDKKLYYYRQRGTSILGNVNEKLIQDFAEIVQIRSEDLQVQYPMLKKEIAYNKINILLRLHLITVRKKELYNSEFMKKQYQELCRLTKKYSSYFKEKSIPKKFRMFTKMCCINRNLFLYITKIFYKIKEKVVQV